MSTDSAVIAINRPCKKFAPAFPVVLVSFSYHDLSLL